MSYSHKLIHTSTLNKVIMSSFVVRHGGGGGGGGTENKYFGINHFISSFAIIYTLYLILSDVVLTAHIQTNFVQST